MDFGRCRFCDGRGEITDPAPAHYPGSPDSLCPCHHCNGTGRIGAPHPADAFPDLMAAESAARRQADDLMAAQHQEEPLWID